MRLGPLFLTALLLLPASSPARVWHVTPGGSTPRIQAAIDSAAVGDTVRVSCGIYHEPAHGWDFGAASCLILKSGVALLGGSDDPSCTVIDARGTGRCFSLTCGPQATLIEGLTFRNGFTKLSRGGGGFVGGGDGPLWIQNCAFADNYAAAAGGGLTIQGPTSQILACAFSENVAGGAGGGLSCVFFGIGPDSRIERCRFSRNRSTGIYGGPGEGGGLDCFVTSGVQIADCVFDANEATNGAGAVLTGIWHGPALHMERCSFFGNAATFRAGALYSLGAVVEMTDCLFETNAGPSNGGAVVALQHSELHLMTCQLSRNSGSLGAAIYGADSTTVNLTSCLLDGNAGDNGGALAAIAYAQYTLDHCTLVSNTATLSGGGLYCHYGSHIQMSHTIVALSAGSQAAFCTDGTSSVTASCSDVFGNAGGDWIAALSGQLGVDGNIQADPLFCGPMSGDFGLHGNSPCAPAHSGACDLIGALPVSCAIEAIEPSSWGRIKASFR